MARNFRRLDDEFHDAFDPDWQDYFKERRAVLDVAVCPVPPPQPQWLVVGLLPLGYLAVLAGRPKDGKTNLAATLAAAVAQGEPFAGMETAKRRVLYLAAEESPEEWEIGLAPWLPETDPAWLQVAHLRFPIDHVPNLYALRLKVQRDLVGLVVIDPLLAATVAGSFAESRRARATLMGLKSMCAELRCSCVVVHHAKERRGEALRVAENPQLAATASLNLVLNHRPATSEEGEGRVVSLAMTGRGPFANRTLELLSPKPCRYKPLPEASPTSR